MPSLQVDQFRDDDGISDSVQFVQPFRAISAWCHYEICPSRMQLFELTLDKNTGLRGAAFKWDYVRYHSLD